MEGLPGVVRYNFNGLEFLILQECPPDSLGAEDRRIIRQGPRPTPEFLLDAQFLDRNRHSRSCRGCNGVGHRGGAGPGYGGMGGRFDNHPRLTPHFSVSGLGHGGDRFGCGVVYYAVPGLWDGAGDGFDDDGYDRLGGGSNGVCHGGSGGRGGSSGRGWLWIGLAGMFGVAACLGGVCLLRSAASRPPTCNIEINYQPQLAQQFQIAQQNLPHQPPMYFTRHFHDA